MSQLIRQLTRELQKQPKKRSNRKTRSRAGFEQWAKKRMETAALPAAYATHVRSRFSAVTQGDEVRISGCDLVYNIPNILNSSDSELFCVIPANPAYWDGTRIAQLAPAYMNYRPMKLSFHYIPQVAVTQQGTVYMGTLWNGAPVGDNLQQTLVTSNGGCLTQCYVPADTVIKLGGNLQQNLFTMNGSLNPDTSPFVFVAGVAGADVTPGYFYVEYEYAFKNPIGQSWIYEVVPITLASSIGSETGVNRSVMLLEPASGLGAGTILDSEVDGFFYHGSSITIAGNTQVASFTNYQSGRASRGFDWDASTWIRSGTTSAAASYNPTSRELIIYDTGNSLQASDALYLAPNEVGVVFPPLVQVRDDVNQRVFRVPDYVNIL